MTRTTNPVDQALGGLTVEEENHQLLQELDDSLRRLDRRTERFNAVSFLAQRDNDSTDVAGCRHEMEEAKDELVRAVRHTLGAYQGRTIF